MKRKVDIFLLLAGLIVLVLVLLPKKKEKPDQLQVDLQFLDEDFIKNLTKIEFVNPVAGPIRLLKKLDTWLWTTPEESYSHPAKLDQFLQDLDKIKLGRLIDPARVPKNFFDSPDTLRWVFFSDQRSLEVAVSSEKSLNGNYYIRRRDGNKTDFHILSAQAKEKLKPTIYRFLANDRYLYSDDITAIQNNVGLKFTKKGSHWEIENSSKEKLLIKASTLKKAFQSIAVKEAYPLESLSMERKVQFAIPPNFQNSKYWKFTFEDGREQKLYVTSRDDAFGYLVDLRQSLVFRGFASVDEFFLGEMGALLQMRDYSLVELKNIDKIVCSISGNIKSFLFSDGSFESETHRIDLVDVSQNLFNLQGSTLSWDLAYRNILGLKFYSKENLQYDFVVGKQGGDYVLHRNDLKYLYKLKEVSKLVIESLLSLCEGES